MLRLKEKHSGFFYCLPNYILSDDQINEKVQCSNEKSSKSCDVRFHVKMRRDACAQTNEAGVMNSDVITYGSVCRDVKLHDLPVIFKSIYLGI
jgi:hypothetical protein